MDVINFEQERAKHTHTGNVKKDGTLERVSFEGDVLEATWRDDEVWVSIKRVCEGIGINYESQFTKLKAKPWATIVLITTVAADGRNRNVSCIRRDKLPMWLATVESGRVSAEVRPKLIAYQNECAEHLARAFGLSLSGAPAAPPSMDDVVRSMAVAAQAIASLGQVAVRQDRRLETVESRLLAVEEAPRVTTTTVVLEAKSKPAEREWRRAVFGSELKRVVHRRGLVTGDPARWWMDLNRGLKRCTGRARKNWDLPQYFLAVAHLRRELGIDLSHVLAAKEEIPT